MERTEQRRRNHAEKKPQSFGGETTRGRCGTGHKLRVGGSGGGGGGVRPGLALLHGDDAARR
eukprot:1956578-Rhodomonas_salina.1